MKIKDLFEKFQMWRWKRNTEKMKKTLKRIQIVAPELSLIPPKNSGIKQLSPAEQIHTFNEIKGIKSQRLNNWIIVILTLVIIILTWQTLIIQTKTSASLIPDLDFKITQRIFPAYQLVGYAHGKENNSYEAVQSPIDLYIINRGQMGTGAIAYRLAEDQRRFWIKDDSNPSVKSLDIADKVFYTIYKDCPYVIGEQNWSKSVLGNCSQNKIGAGLMKWYLLVDCPGCQFKTNPECYTFNTCIWNSSTQNEDWCKKQLEGNDQFVKVECPDPFLE